MQELPSLRVLMNYAKYYDICCENKLSCCNANEDYEKLKKTKLTEQNIKECLRSIVFYIDIHVIHPRLKILMIQINNRAFDTTSVNNKVNFGQILINNNIIDYNKYYGQQITKKTNFDDKIKYKYIEHYTKLQKEYEDKINFIKKNIPKVAKTKIKKEINTISGGSVNWFDAIKADVSNLNNMELLIRLLIIKLKPKYVSSILNIYVVNPLIDTIIIDQKNIENILDNYKNYYNVKDNTLTIYDMKSSNHTEYVYKFDKDCIDYFNIYIRDYNIQHNKKLFGDISYSLFNKIIKKIFKVNFSQLKNLYPKV
jgi:hypothetical protein